MPRMLLAILVLVALVPAASAQGLSGALQHGTSDDDHDPPQGGRGTVTISGADLGPDAGNFDIELDLGADPRTRREAIIDMLREMFEGYVDRDIGRFYKSIAPDAVFGAGIARNAVMKDFQTLINVNVDVEVTQYRFTLGTVCVDFRWRRVATDVNTGAPQVLDGTSQFCGHRSTSFRFQRIVGVPPFGQSDPQFVQQVQAGQPTPSPTPTPTPTPTTPGMPMGTTIALGFSTGQGAAIDFDAGTAQIFSGQPVTPPGTDLTIYWPNSVCQGPCQSLGLQAGGATFGVNADATMFFSAQGSAEFQPCDATTPGFGAVGAVGPDSALTTNLSLNPSNSPHIGVKTTDGQFAVVALDLPASVTFLRSSSRQVISQVAEVCSTTPQGR